MTLFTRLKAQTAEIEASLRRFSVSSSPEDPIAAHVMASSILQSAVGIKDKLAKLRAKAQLTGEGRIYNENKSTEILLFCTKFDELLAEVTDISTVTAKKAHTREEELKASKELALELEREAEAKRVKEENAASVVPSHVEEEIIAAATTSSPSCPVFDNHVDMLVVQAHHTPHTTINDELAMETPASDETPVLSPSNSTILAETTTTTVLASKPNVPELPTGFYLRLAVAGSSESRREILELPNGCNTTIEELHNRIASSLKVESRCVLFSGGRQLKNPNLTLQQCRMKTGTLIHVGIPD